MPPRSLQLHHQAQLVAVLLHPEREGEVVGEARVVAAQIREIQEAGAEAGELDEVLQQFHSPWMSSTVEIGRMMMAIFQTPSSFRATADLQSTLMTNLPSPISCCCSPPTSSWLWMR